MKVGRVDGDRLRRGFLQELESGVDRHNVLHVAIVSPDDVARTQ